MELPPEVRKQFQVINGIIYIVEGTSCIFPFYPEDKIAMDTHSGVRWNEYLISRFRNKTQSVLHKDSNFAKFEIHDSNIFPLYWSL